MVETDGPNVPDWAWAKYLAPLDLSVGLDERASLPTSTKRRTSMVSLYGDGSAIFRGRGLATRSLILVTIAAQTLSLFAQISIMTQIGRPLNAITAWSTKPLIPVHSAGESLRHGDLPRAIYSAKRRTNSESDQPDPVTIITDRLDH